MLPAVKPRIEGPLARSDQGDCQAKHPQHRGNGRMGRDGKGDPDLRARRQHSGKGCPQTGDQQEARQTSDYLWRSNRAAACRDYTVQKSSADQQPLEQKPGARRAVGECRK